jgi:hypothetical protein
MSFVFDPYSHAVHVDPFPLYARLREEFPCYWSEPGRCRVLSRYDDIVAAPQDWRTYPRRSRNRCATTPARSGSGAR